MVFLIDFSVIAIIAFCVWRGFVNGLIRGVFGVVTLIAALIMANTIATAYSEEFTGMLKPFVGGIVDTTLVDILGEEAGYNSINRFDREQSYTTSLSALRQIGLPDSSAGRVAEMVSQSDDFDFSLSEIIAEKLSSALAFIAVYGVAFILLSIIFAVAGNLINFVFSLPGLKLVDRIAGTALGLIKGFIIVLALAVVVRYFGLLAQDTLEQTSVLSYFVNKNLIANALGL